MISERRREATFVKRQVSLLDISVMAACILNPLALERVGARH